MKFAKLMDRINALFNAEQRERSRRRSELKVMLKKIRHKQHELEQQLADCNSELERTSLEEKISILNTQRSKGLELLKDMNQDTEN